MKISRRDFLKAAIASGLVATVPGGALHTLIEKPAHKPGQATYRLQQGERAGARLYRSACFICGQKCPIKVKVDGGRILTVIYNTDGANDSQYACCGRPHTIFEARTLKERIRAPLAREGERGSGSFREISWSEALDTLASWLREVEPGEVIVFSHQGCESGIVKEFFKNIVGVPNVTKHCDTCHTAIDYASWWVFGKLIGPSGFRPDYENARLVVFMGRNPVEGIVAAPWTKMFAEGRKRGMRIIAFDVRRSRLTALADKYYLIPPGTDLAAALAILHVILRDGLYDEDYLRRYTNAPMLVYTDTLEPVGLADNPKVEGKKTYKVLDEADGAVKWKTEATRPALLGEVNIGGRTAKTALQLLKEAVSSYTPGWAEEVTGVPAEELEWVARSLAYEAPRAFIDPGYKGTRYKSEGMLFRVIHLVNVMLGAVGARGGVAWNKKPKIKSPFKILGIEGLGPQGEPLYKYWEEHGVAFVNHKCYSMLAIRSILEEKPRRYRMAIIFNQNLVAHVQGSSDVIRALKKLDYVVVMDTVFNETAVYADLILPLPMFFETSSPTLFTPSKTGTGQLVVVEKAIDPPPGYDVRPAWWIIKELGKRLDPGNSALYEMLGEHEYIWRKQAEDLGIDPEGLLERGVATLYKSPIYHPLKGKSLYTVTGEIEVLNVEGLSRYRGEAGKPSSFNPFPAWIPPAWMSQGPLGDDEAVAVDICHRMTATNMWIRYTRLTHSTLKWDRMDGVLIHRGKAEKLGIRDGDTIVLEGPGGSLEAKARVTEDIHPTVVLAPHATNPGPAGGWIKVRYRSGEERLRLFHRTSGAGLNTNMLHRLGDMVMEEGGRAIQNDVRVRIRRR
ncbi:MAG: molybdopterin-dependent oxidoreductase [Desulfurococcales archaeon]|nr:molybdopterin-dependent oxidoreductase [Desulfurococcales archaeon]